MSNIEQAFSVWEESLVTSYDMLFSSPEEWNSDVWDLVKNLNATMVIIGAALLGLMFMIGICKQMTDIKQLRQLEFWVGPLFRLILAELAMVWSLELLMTIFSVCQGLMSKIGRIQTDSYDISIPGAVIQAFEDTSIWQDLGIGIIGLLVLILCLVQAITLLVTIWGRFLRLYLYTAVAPIFIAFGAGEATGGAAVTFIKSWVNVCMQGVIMMLALVIYAKLIVSDNSTAIAMIENGETFGGIMRYVRDFTIGAMVTVGLCRGSDQIVSKMTGW